MKWFYIKLLCLGMVLGLVACSKILDTKPVSGIESEVFYNSKEAAEMGLTGCYNRFFNENAYPLMLCFFQVSSDDIKQPTGYAYTLKSRNLVTPNPASGGGYDVPWLRMYTAITNINVMLKGVAAIPDEKFTGNRKKEILAEGHFLRGACYYYLTMLWGDIPMVLDVITGGSENVRVMKSSQKEVLAQVKADLQIAERDLETLNYPAAAVTNLRKGRASKWAAKAFLARIALWENDKLKALQLSEEILNSNLFPLSTGIRSIFQGPMNSSESIFEQQNDISPGFFGSGIYGYIMGFDFEMSDELYNLYDKPDVPKVSQGKDIRFDLAFPYRAGTRKMVPATGFANNGLEQMNIVVFRSTEFYFNKYELLIEQDYATHKTAALNFLNTIRARAKDDSWTNPYYPNMPKGTSGIPPLTAADVDTPAKMMSALKAEKRRELAFEDGIRWFDIMRWDKAYAMQITNASSEGRLYLPIPEDELVRNPALTQNPAWQ